MFSLRNKNEKSAEGYLAPGKDHVSMTSSGNALYLYQVLPKYLKGFQLLTWTVGSTLGGCK